MPSRASHNANRRRHTAAGIRGSAGEPPRPQARTSGGVHFVPVSLSGPAYPVDLPEAVKELARLDGLLDKTRITHSWISYPAPEGA